MAKDRWTQRLTPWVLFLTTGMLASLSTWTDRACAEEPGIDPTGKGIAGGALLGGELVVSLEAAFGVQSEWAYLGGGFGGAVAGGVGGYFVEQAEDPQPSYYLLAAGMALLVPTTVAVLQATSYQAPGDYTEDRPGPGTQPAQQPPLPEPEGKPPETTVTVSPPEASAPPPVRSGHTARRAVHRRVPSSLVDMHTGTVRVGLPAVQIRPTYSTAEVRKYGVSQHAELQLPIFHATF